MGEANQGLDDDFSIWEPGSADGRCDDGDDSPLVSAGAPAPPLRDGSVLPGAVRDGPRLLLSLPREPGRSRSFWSLRRRSARWAARHSLAGLDSSLGWLPG